MTTITEPPNTINQVQIPAREFIVKESPSSDELKLWLDEINDYFFSKLEVFSDASLQGNPNIAHYRPKQTEFTGHSCCQEAARMLGEAIIQKYHLPPEHVLFAVGWVDKSPAHRQIYFSDDAWIRVTGLRNGKELCIHPTYGQFRPEYVRRIFICEADREQEYGISVEGGVRHPRLTPLTRENQQEFILIKTLARGEQPMQLYVSIVSDLAAYSLNAK